MGIVITILLIGLIIYSVAKSSSKSTLTSSKKIPFEITVSTSVNSGFSSSTSEKFNPIKQNLEGYWILNPESPFELTVLSTDKILANKVRKLLDDDQLRENQRTERLLELVIEFRLKIKEIEEYKNKYKGQYLSHIKELKEKSSEWATLGEKDREDLLIEFRQSSINRLYERANCELNVFFEYEPIDRTHYDLLIKEFGFENIKIYLRYSDNPGKIRIIPNDNYLRPGFEKLVDLGLAIRGNNIPINEILFTLTLNELNAIASNLEKEYKRKNLAIEYILAQNNYQEKIGKYVSMREVFKLNPLPEKFNSLNINEINAMWSYHEEEVNFLIATFQNSFYAWRDFKDSNYVKGYWVESSNGLNPCPCAKEFENKRFSVHNPPKIPRHIGCNCFLRKEY